MTNEERVDWWEVYSCSTHDSANERGRLVGSEFFVWSSRGYVREWHTVEPLADDRVIEQRDLWNMIRLAQILSRPMGAQREGRRGGQRVGWDGEAQDRQASGRTRDLPGHPRYLFGRG